MDEVPRVVSEVSLTESKRWVGRFLVALLLAESILGVIVSLTNNVIVPALAALLGSDAGSPLSFGKRDYDIPAFFISLVEFFLAALVAIVVNAWVQRRPRVVRRMVTATAPAPAPTPRVVAPPTAPIAAPPTVPVTRPTAPVAAAPPPPVLTKAKPKKDVYYNIVGEPIDSDEE